MSVLSITAHYVHLFLTSHFTDKCLALVIVLVKNQSNPEYGFFLLLDFGDYIKDSDLFCTCLPVSHIIFLSSPFCVSFFITQFNILDKTA